MNGADRLKKSEINSDLPRQLQLYITLIAVAGMGLMAYLATGVDWGLSTLVETGLFVFLIVVAGSFPLRVSPKVLADVTTAILFSAALILEPGAAALAGVIGITTYTLVNRRRGGELRLPWYKYPFNAGETALFVGATSLIFHGLTSGDGVINPAVVPAAAGLYLGNTALVSVAVSLQQGVNPLRVWWQGTRENGPAELSQLSFGFLGAVVYRESIWAVVALFIPVAMIYVAFSRLARANSMLEEALMKLESLQGRIVSTSKLASIGALSLDLAHQIKNPLAILIGRLEGLQERFVQGTQDRRHLDAAADAGWRIQQLTQTFTSIGQQRWLQLDARELLDEAFGMAGLHSHKMIEIRRDYGESQLKVKGNPVLIREVLTNIFSNAMEAVENGNLITIGVSRVNGSVVLSIADTGVGIPKTRMGHLFEPFQSTKPNGYGLGLFAAKHILEMHKGSLEIESEEGVGTWVTVKLPADSDSDEETLEHSDRQTAQNDLEQARRE